MQQPHLLKSADARACLLRCCRDLPARRRLRHSAGRGSRSRSSSTMPACGWQGIGVLLQVTDEAVQALQTLRTAEQQGHASRRRMIEGTCQLRMRDGRTVNGPAQRLNCETADMQAVTPSWKEVRGNSDTSRLDPASMCTPAGGHWFGRIPGFLVGSGWHLAANTPGGQAGSTRGLLPGPSSPRVEGGCATSQLPLAVPSQPPCSSVQLGLLFRRLSLCGWNPPSCAGRRADSLPAGRWPRAGSVPSVQAQPRGVNRWGGVAGEALA